MARKAVLSASAMTLLAAVAAATATEAGHGWVANSDDATALVTGGYIEVNTDQLNEANEAAARATEKGIKEAGASAGGETAAPAAAPTFERIRMAMPARTTRNRAGFADKFGLGDLEAPTDNGEPVDGIFIPATADTPKPWDKYSSAVSKVSRDHATVKTPAGVDPTTGKKTQAVYEHSKKFTIARVVHPTSGVEGAYITRTK